MRLLVSSCTRSKVFSSPPAEQQSNEFCVYTVVTQDSVVLAGQRLAAGVDELCGDSSLDRRLFSVAIRNGGGLLPLRSVPLGTMGPQAG